MKSLKFILAGLLCTLCAAALLAQDESQRPQFVVFTTEHWNYDNEDGSRAEWMSLASEYFEKVVKKNEHISGAATLVHYYTGDNSELIHVRTYMNWDDIEKAQDRTDELEAEAWPDEDARGAFFEKFGKYTTGRHSDEIYRTLNGAKLPDEPMEEQMVVYIQKWHGDWPSDGSGSMDEIVSLNKQYQEVAFHGNDHIKAYYPMRHAWGADNREFLDVFVVSSLDEISAMNMAMDDLIEEAWPDEDERKAFFDRFDLYATGWHGDFIYRTIPELRK